ncbi:MAG TPA: hypothetical protein VF198_13250 [Vicinamibacterales bacterium]
MTRSTGTFLASAALLAVCAAPLHAAPERSTPPMTASLTAGTDDGVVLEVASEGLTVRKTVYPDGRFIADLHFGRDRIVLSGDHDGVRVARGRALVHLPPGAAAQEQGRQVRAWLGASQAVQRFRQLVGALESAEAFDGAALSLRATGALLAELGGDGAAAQRFGRQLQARLGGRVRRIAQTYPASCWDQYERAVVAAANELERCLADFAVYNPTRNLCVFVWVLKVEAAWFGLLKCSAVPLG